MGAKVPLQGPERVRVGGGPEPPVAAEEHAPAAVGTARTRITAIMCSRRVPGSR